MLLGGDEIGRTQRGNNNAYCQDNEMSWYDWEHPDEDLLRFTRELIHFRLRHPAFRRRAWFQGKAIHGVEDIAWYTPDGREMSEQNWGEGFAKSMAVFLNGRAIRTPDASGQHVEDDSYLILFNAHNESIDFTLPDARSCGWRRILDTAAGGFVDDEAPVACGRKVTAGGRSLVVLRQESPDA